MTGTITVMEGMSLRERKRLATMRHVQSVAVELFEHHGFGGVTIERIAQAAEVSPSSVYRHFGTKEQLVLWDEYDPMLLERLAELLVAHPPVEAMRELLRTKGHPLLGSDEERVRSAIRWWSEEPSVALAAAAQFASTVQAIAHVLGHAYGRQPEELEVQAIAGALVASVEAALRTWYHLDFAPSVLDLLDRALATLDDGLRLHPSA
jgi:AcrR family transcriptional regulator